MAGFEGSDSGGNVVVARSFFRDNRVGVLLVSAGEEDPYHQQDTTVVGNVIADNANRDRARPRRELRRRRARARRAPRRAGAQPHHGPPRRRRPADRLRRRARGRGQRAGQPAARQRRRPRRWRRAPASARRRARASPRTASARRCRRDIEKVLPCQSDVPLRTDDPALPQAPPGVDWRTVSLPGPQPSLPEADAGKPKPARRAGAHRRRARRRARRAPTRRASGPGPSGARSTARACR